MEVSPPMNSRFPSSLCPPPTRASGLQNESEGCLEPGRPRPAQIQWPQNIRKTTPLSSSVNPVRGMKILSQRSQRFTERLLDIRRQSNEEALVLTFGLRMAAATDRVRVPLKSRSGGMADAPDSKSGAFTGVWVQVPSPVPRFARNACSIRRGAGVADRARLESVYTSKGYRGFESLPLRHFSRHAFLLKMEGHSISIGSVR